MSANIISRMVFKNVSYGLSDAPPKALWVEDELDYNEDDEYEEEPLDPESWQDWHSEELLDDYMKIRDSYERWYLRTPFSFNQWCEHVYKNS